jgi:hypothetical protein
VPERVVRLVGRDVGFAAPVAFSGEQVPGALGLGQLAAAAEFPEVQVRLGCPAPPFGLPVREGSRRVEVGHAAGAGQLIDVGGDPLQDRGHPGQVGHHVRPVGMIVFGAQVDRRGELLGGRWVSQPAHWRSQPTSSSRRSQIRSRPSSSASSSPSGSSGAGQPAARGPQLAQGGIQPVQVRVGRDLVHPRR